MLNNYRINSKSLGHTRKTSNNYNNMFNNRQPNTINHQKVQRPVYIPPPQYKYSLAKTPMVKNNFEPSYKEYTTPSTNIVLGKTRD